MTWKLFLLCAVGVLAVLGTAPAALAAPSPTPTLVALLDEGGLVVGSVAFAQNNGGSLGELTAVQRGAPNTTYRMCLLSDRVPADTCEVLQTDGPGAVVLGSLTTDGLGRGLAQPQVVTLTRLRAAFGEGSLVARVELAAISPPSGGCLTARGITFVVPLTTIT